MIMEAFWTSLSKLDETICASPESEMRPETLLWSEKTEMSASGDGTDDDGKDQRDDEQLNESEPTLGALRAIAGTAPPWRRARPATRALPVTS